MSDAGWHPDPLGRADRRYHDGTGWTEHIADAEGTATVDPRGADPEPDAAGSPDPDGPAANPGIVIGPPPPRRPRDHAAPAPSPEAAPADATIAAPPTAPPTSPPSSPPPTTSGPVVVPPAASPSLAKAALDEPTTADLPPAADAGSPQTERMGPEDIAAAAALADATGRIPRHDGLPHGTGPGRPPPGGAPAKAGLSVLGLIGAVAGVALGLVSLLVLPWLSGGDEVDDASYLDLRDAVTAAGPDIGAIANGFIVSGALFVVAVGGVVAVARALGVAAGRVLATIVVLGGLAALSVMGFLDMDVDEAPAGTDAASIPAPAGSPVTTPTGDTIIDPATGAPVTTPGADPAAPPSEGQGIVIDPSAAEDRLAAAAVLGMAVMGVAAALCVIGLLLKQTAGHVVAALGLLVGALWAAGAVALLSTEDDVGDLGLGPYGVVACGFLLAVSAALPGRRRTPAA